MIRKLSLLTVALALVAAACGDDGGGDDDAASGNPSGEAASDGEGGSSEDDASMTSLELASSDLGDIVVDGAGNTVYLFEPDAQGESTCYEECAANWPPLGEVSSVSDDLDTSLVGTTTRDDGSVQATYDGWPLYYFARDANAGDTNGQGVNDVWWVIDAAGAPIETTSGA